MSYTIQTIENKEIWDTFVTSQKNHVFLQSWNYGEMQKSLGDIVERIGLYENNVLIGAVQILKVKAKRGNYYFIPYGPLLDYSNSKVVHFFFDAIKEKAKKDAVDFIRIHPPIKQSISSQQIFKANGFKKAPIHLVSDNFWVLDITKSDEILMKEMRKNTRNLIRRAIKEEVTIRKGISEELLRDFFTLYEKTAKRHHFTPYSKAFITKQVQSFKQDNQVEIIIASHNGELISGAIVMFYGNMASYHHGASIPSKIPATYLMQWEAIQLAKKKGMKYYNFWGIVIDKPKHPWAGLSFFKQGFGGKHFIMLPAQDYMLSWKYILTYCIEFIRKIKRGL